MKTGSLSPEKSSVQSHSRSQKKTLHNLIVKIKEMEKKNHTAGRSLLEVGGQEQVTGSDPGMVRGGAEMGSAPSLTSYVTPDKTWTL